jgi:hypothetical protein|eukprot:COSAG02_NODE_8334_length_2610_cov_1.954998_3_plen_39_part_00
MHTSSEVILNGKFLQSRHATSGQVHTWASRAEAPTHRT